jgi:4-alpha-glucanotransferase
LLSAAWDRFRAGARKDLIPEYEEFCWSRARWLEDYALYRALKIKYNSQSFLEWPEELIQRVPAALTQARQSLANEIDRIRLAQFLLHRQSRRLKEHAHAQGVRLIGDLPFFVSFDSSDVWANPELFLLDEHRRPRVMAGVPADYFNADGQLWGNPIYDWVALARTGYRWCIDRIIALLAHVDLIRLDHFLAFSAAWHVPAGAPTAKNGEWVPGPGAVFFHAVRNELGSLPFIAEDLGLVTPEVDSLRDQFQIPGTRVLQFAFDGNKANVHLPDNYSANTVVYTATHDNATTREWYQGLPDCERRSLWALVGRPVGKTREVAPEMIRLAWSSPAALALAPLQDVLNLGPEGRMNIPGRAEGNWRWRATPHMLSARNFHWLGDLTKASSRGLLPLPVMEAAS